MVEHTTAGGLIVETRAIDWTPNANDPLEHPPASVGPPTAAPGDPHGVELVGGPLAAARTPVPPVVMPWSGWPADWMTPNWYGRVETLTDTAWMCLDLNASALGTMPPYLVNAAQSLNADWINNPDPAQYASWPEFAKSLFWNFQLGEAFVLATARYDNGTGWPARFHVVEPWMVEVDFTATGTRRYKIGGKDVSADMLHIRYTSRVGDAHGHGPLEAGAARLLAANALARYASQLATAGGVPPAVLKHPGNLDKTQADDLKANWLESRMSAMGLPAVLSGGVEFEVLGVSPKDMAFVDLAQWNESRIAVLLQVPPFIAGLPSGGDSMTYANVSSIFDYWWRVGLKTKASLVMQALSGWALPRGTAVELNRDELVRPGPYERAQTWQILSTIGVLDADEIREIERYNVAGPSATLTSGVLQ
jgi:HK97 family phage portal protein